MNDYIRLANVPKVRFFKIQSHIGADYWSLLVYQHETPTNVKPCLHCNPQRQGQQAIIMDLVLMHLAI